MNESKLEEERDLFEEFGMQPQVKSAPRITVSSPVKPPATALDSTTHRDTVTTTTTTPRRTRFYQVEDTDNFADQWFEGNISKRQNFIGFSFSFEVDDCRLNIL